MSATFLRTGGALPARSPMERQALAAGARIDDRHGWRVATGYDRADTERERARNSVGFADVSHLAKLELHTARDGLSTITGAPVEPGRAVRAAGTWWCPVTPERTLALCAPDSEDALWQRVGTMTAVPVTTVHAALTIAGPLARETLARFCAIDLRPGVAPVGAFRPGSVARTPGCVLREAEERYLVLFGWALGEYLWTVVADAADGLGGGPIGLDCLEEAHGLA